ncbi:MAG TPA: LytTR family DNA-binding domain-containing protein [Arachidicoccus sp.]
MKKISCIIVDDEQLARSRIEKYVSMTPFLELAGQFENAMQALEILQTNTVELVFLDIQMPGLNGIEFSKTISKDIKIIFTTAFDSYAIEGYKVNALDYLLKPFNYEEFFAAVIKAKEWFESNLKKEAQSYAQAEFIFVRSEYKLLKVPLAEVLYFEGAKDYIKIRLFSQPRPIMTLMSLKAMERLLPSGAFMRVHRSYIIALDKILSIENNHAVFSNGVHIFIAEQYRNSFQNFIDCNLGH